MLNAIRQRNIDHLFNRLEAAERLAKDAYRISQAQTDDYKRGYNDCASKVAENLQMYVDELKGR